MVGRIQAALIGILVVVSLLTAGLSTTPLARDVEARLLDARFALRDAPSVAWLGLYRPVPLNPDVVVLALDQKTYDTIEDPALIWNPYYAQVITEMDQAGTRALGLDMIQTVSLDKLNPGQDELLAQALADSHIVVLAFGIRRASGPRQARVAEDVSPQNTTWGPQYPYFLNVLQDGYDALGCVNMFADPDGVIRRYPMLRTYHDVKQGDRALPSMAFQLLRRYTGQHVKTEDVVAGRPFQLGNLIIPWDDRFCIQTNYAGPGSTFPRVSFVDALTHAQQKDHTWFRQTFGGKLVLLGQTDSLTYADTKNTPYGLMSGVEVHANAVNTVLTQRYLQSIGDVRGHLLAFALIAVAGWLLFHTDIAHGVLGLIGVAFLLTWISAFCFSRWGVILPTFELLSGAVMSGLAVMALRVGVLDRHSNRIRSLFGRYVSPSVMKTLLSDPEHLALGAVGKRRVTVLFTDINGFSTVCEKHTPEEIVEMLNCYFKEMTDIIHWHDGTIKQFVGDEIMVMWGAPQPHPQPEIAAVQTALEMVHHLERLEKTGPPGFYHVKIGIHTGEVIVGNVGSEERTEYAAVGDNVNIGARLEAMTKTLGAAILISEDTYEQVKHMEGVVFVNHGPRDVKGRQGAISVYEVRRAEDFAPKAHRDGELTARQ